MGNCLAPVILSVVLAIAGCSPAGSPAAANSAPIGATDGNAGTSVNGQPSSNSNTSEPNVLFTIREGGPVQRIEAEGRGDEQIRKNIAEVDKSITYAHLEKNADRYSGAAYAVTGKVVQIIERGNQTVAIVGSNSWAGKNFWIVCNFTTDIIKGDQVYAVGYLDGSHSYKSVAGWDLTIPTLVARAMLKSKDAARYLRPPK